MSFYACSGGQGANIAPMSRMNKKSEETPPQPKLCPENEFLNAFVGKWHVMGPGISGQESYEWLPGGFFMLYRWDRHSGDDEKRGVGILGFNGSTQRYFAYLFDNRGYFREYDVTVSNRILEISRSGEERGIISLSSDDNLMRIHWERTEDGRSWQSMYDMNAIKWGGH